MPEAEPEKMIIPAGTPDSSGADRRDTEPDRKTSGSSVAPAGKKQPVPRRAKWAIVLLSVLCLLFLGALVELACLPYLLERDINNQLLKRLSKGSGIKIEIKGISLTSAEVACSFTDNRGVASRGSLQGEETPRRDREVGSIGTFSIRYSPVGFLLRKTIEAVEVKDLNVKSYYSDGSVTFPVFDVIADLVKSFQTGEPKEKDDSPFPDDLNAVIPVKIKHISIDGELLMVFLPSKNLAEEKTVSADSSSVDQTAETGESNGKKTKNRYVPLQYKVSVESDQQGDSGNLDWNKLACSLSVFYDTSIIKFHATYLHKEKRVVFDLDKLAFTTSNMSREVRTALKLPHGLRADVSLNSQAEIDIAPFLAMGENDLMGVAASAVREKSSVDGSVSFAFHPRTVRRPSSTRQPQEASPMNMLSIDSETSFSLKMLPDEVVSLSVGTLKGEYDAIPFEVGGIEAAVSLPKRTVKGGFQVKVAESEPALFSVSGSMNDERTGIDLSLDNTPLLKALYKGIDVSLRPTKFTAKADMIEDVFSASAVFAFSEVQTGIEVGAIMPELKGLTADIKPESITGKFEMNGEKLTASAVIAGGGIHAGFEGMDFDYRPETISAGFGRKGEEKSISAGITGGELVFKKEGINATFKHESFTADAKLGDMIESAHAKLTGGTLGVELDGMSCSADKLAFDAGSEDGKTYTGKARVKTFQFKKDDGKLVYKEPELELNVSFADGLLSGKFVGDESELSMPELDLCAKNLHWDFPFDYALSEAEEDAAEKAAPAAPRTGTIALGDIELKGTQAASFKNGTIQWDDAAKTLHLKTDANLFSVNGQIYADVVLGDAGMEMNCCITIPDQDADLSKDLAAFFPQFEQISCTGKFGGSAVYSLLPKTTTGNAKFHIADADVLIPEQNLEVRGVSLGFEVPEIAALKSAPGQTLSFKSIKYNKYEVGAGRAAFRMEAPDTWQIENALVDWCNGHIRLGSITYRFGQTTTEAVLYCDRLELPLFLSQIGLGEISGSGSINGTIPIVLVQKTDAFGNAKIDNIYFEDAFLFSTPGEVGVIKGDLDEALTNAGTGIEMELAKDALKDFSYSWVRMRMQSTGPDKENLKLSFEVDGRPNRALYYSFDESTASFIKSDTPCIFQGIRLDTNVNMYGKAMELVDYFRQIFSKGDQPLSNLIP